MRKAGEIAEKAVGSKVSSKPAKPTLPAIWISALFAKLQARYGLQFANQWRTEDERRLALTEWGYRLASLTPEQLARGLEAWQGAWPPNVEEFRQAAVGDKSGLTHNTAAYTRVKKALPKPKADPDTVRNELAKMRECLRK